MTATLVKDLVHFDVLKTWIDGTIVFADGKTRLPSIPVKALNKFAAWPIAPGDLVVKGPANATSCSARIIVADDGQLITGSETQTLSIVDGTVQPDPARDILLIAVVNRYEKTAPALAFIRGFGLREGAIASSVAHDSHNIVAVGCDPESLARAINAVIATQGGLAITTGKGHTDCLALPIAGLMSDGDGDQIARQFKALTTTTRDQLGSPMRSPLMALSFMALLVIPALKLSDKGLFDGTAFRFCDVVAKA